MRIRNLMIATECASYGPGARPLRPSLAAAAVASDGPDSPGVAVAGEAGSNVTVAKAATPGGAAAAAAVKRLVGGVAAAAASAPFGAPSRAAARLPPKPAPAGRSKPSGGNRSRRPFGRIAVEVMQTNGTKGPQRELPLGRIGPARTPGDTAASSDGSGGGRQQTEFVMLPIGIRVVRAAPSSSRTDCRAD
jgi:hypothetical protein